MFTVLVGIVLHALCCSGVDVSQIMSKRERDGFPLAFPELNSRVERKDRTNPGLRVTQSGGYTPQGITFFDDKTVLVSLYSLTSKVTHANSLFAAVPRSGDYKLLKAFELVGLDGKPLTVHVGGIQRTDKYVWTCEDYTIYAFAVEDIEDALATPDGETIKLMVRHSFKVDSRASWVSRSPVGTVPGINEEILWVGDFHAPGPFSVPSWHKGGWMAAYGLGTALGLPSTTTSYDTDHGALLRPDGVLFLNHDGVQGAAACKDKVFTSVSSQRYSRLRMFDAPFANNATNVQLPNNMSTPGWRLDPSETAGLDTPSSSEDLDVECTADGQASRLGMNFESASITYRYIIRALLGYVEDRWFDVDVKGLPDTDVWTQTHNELLV